MRYFNVVGQCVAVIASQLSEIGFKNIASLQRNKDNVMLHDKNGDIYIVKVIKVYDKEKNKTLKLPDSDGQYHRSL